MKISGWVWWFLFCAATVAGIIWFDSFDYTWVEQEERLATGCKIGVVVLFWICPMVIAWADKLPARKPRKPIRTVLLGTYSGYRSDSALFMVYYDDGTRKTERYERGTIPYNRCMKLLDLGDGYKPK